jgi:hypothetical protein
MRAILPIFTAAYGLISLLFGLAAFVLMGFGAAELWEAVVTERG